MAGNNAKVNSHAAARARKKQSKLARQPTTSTSHTYTNSYSHTFSKTKRASSLRTVAASNAAKHSYSNATSKTRRKRKHRANKKEEKKSSLLHPIIVPGHIHCSPNTTQWDSAPTIFDGSDNSTSLPSNLPTNVTSVHATKLHIPQESSTNEGLIYLTESEQSPIIKLPRKHALSYTKLHCESKASEVQTALKSALKAHHQKKTSQARGHAKTLFSSDGIPKPAFVGIQASRNASGLRIHHIKPRCLHNSMIT